MFWFTQCANRVRRSPAGIRRAAQPTGCRGVIENVPPHGQRWVISLPPHRGLLDPPKSESTTPLKKWISGPPKKRSTGPEKSRSVGQVCRSHFWERKTGPFRSAIYCFKLRTPRVPVLRSHFWHRGIGQKDPQKVGQ